MTLYTGEETDQNIKFLCIEIWHYSAGKDRRKHQNILNCAMALYFGKGYEGSSKYCVLRYGIIL
jgi:hypothetical protein